MSTSPAAPGRRGRLDVLLCGLFILAVCLAFQGSRGLFEPDEGRYVDAALAMLRGGDWLVPRLQGLVYLDKPPAIYWTIAAGIKLLGTNEWGARIGLGLALAATAYLVAWWSAVAWGRRAGLLAGAFYATTLLPALAANALTPDTLLVVWTTAASFSYWQWRSSSGLGERWRWALLLGLATGLGLLTKGTAALVFLAPAVIHGLWDSGPRRFLSRPELWVAALVGSAIGLSWYASVAGDVPGAAQYFFDNQVAGRLWKSSYARHSQWWAAFEVYLPIVVLGGLPWSLAWLTLWRSPDRRQRLRDLWSEPLNRFLVLSALLPLAIFSLASSKLPLYILPVSPYLVMLTIAHARRDVRPRWGRRVLAAAAVVILLRGTAALVPAERDSRALAAALRRAGVTTEECIGALQTKIHGLAMYGYPHVTWHTLWPETYPYFEPPGTLGDDLPALGRRCGGGIRVIVRHEHRQSASDLLARSRFACSDKPIGGRFTLLSCAKDSAAGPG